LAHEVRTKGGDIVKKYSLYLYAGILVLALVSASVAQWVW
jgi:hypothetical protein